MDGKGMECAAIAARQRVRKHDAEWISKGGHNWKEQSATAPTEAINNIDAWREKKSAGSCGKSYLALPNADISTLFSILRLPSCRSSTSYY